MKYKAKSLKCNAESRDCTAYGVRKSVVFVGKAMYNIHLLHYKTLDVM